MRLMEWIRKATSTKYTRALEMDLARLRAENRALLNSILGIAGVPPIVVADNNVSPAAGLKPPPQPAASANGLRPPARKGSGAPVNGLIVAGGQKAAPMRRRSWQQIYRMLEINSARKKDASEIV